MTREGRAPVLRLGLTGGIGSGKSTVASMLAALGAHAIDADAASRSTTQAGGAAIEPIRQAFGESFIDKLGALDRAAMREHIFAHPNARAQLEAIVHPLVTEAILQQEAASQAECLVFDVPLLVEGHHWRHQLDRVWVVDCSLDTQLQRVQARNGWSADAVGAVIAAQSTRERRLGAADTVIFNDGLSIAELQAQVRQLAARLGL